MRTYVGFHLDRSRGTLGLMSLTDMGTPCLPINRSWNRNHIEVVKVFHMVSKPVLSALVAKVNTVVIITRNYLGCLALSPLLEGRHVAMAK